MLAFTTYAEPRNLLIDLAFLGLSTITSAGRSPLATDSESLSDFAPDGRPWQRGALAAARFGAGFFGAGSVGRRSRLLGLASHSAVLPILFQKTAWVDLDSRRADGLERVIEIVLLVKSCYDDSRGRSRSNPATFP